MNSLKQKLGTCGLALLAGLFIATVAPAAHSSQTMPTAPQEYFWTNYWSGEYPLNFRVTKNVTVPARSAPESAAVADQTCLLKRGAKIGPQQKFAADYYTRFTVENFLVKQDFIVEDHFSSTEPPRQIQLKAGDVVQDVAYLAEGFCRIRTPKGLHESTCFGNLGGPEAANFVSLNPAAEGEVRFQEWFSLKCGGKTSWVLVQDLESLFENSTLRTLPPAF